MSAYDRFDKQVAEGTVDVALGELARSRAGDSGQSSFAAFYRFIVLDVVFDPTTVNDETIARWEHDLGVRNVGLARDLPRNTIIGQRVLEGTASDAESPMFLFPFLPPAVSLPCNPGEHVWVMLEGRSTKRADVGFWVGRVVGPGRVEDVNHSHAPRAFDVSFIPGTKDMHDGRDQPVYEFRPGAVSERPDGTRSTAHETTTLRGEDERAYERMMTESDAGKVRTYEPVPRFRKRPGDVALEGANNALIVVGDHRTSTVSAGSSGLAQEDLPGPERGEIDIVVGRGQVSRTLGATVENSLGFREVAKGQPQPGASEGDPDLSSDRSRVRLSQRSRVDVELGLESFNGELSIGDRESGDGAVVVKSDKVRLIARSDIELLVQGFSRDADGRMVSSEDESQWAAIVIRANGDIIFRPAAQGVLKLGGDDADKAIMCTDQPAVIAAGNVTSPPLVTTMGGALGTNATSQGTFGRKVLIK